MIGALTQPAVTRLDELAWVIEAEFKEMPGMRLTLAQVKRLWSLSADDCGRVLDYLVSARLLVRDDDGRFCRDVEAC